MKRRKMKRRLRELAFRIDAQDRRLVALNQRFIDLEHPVARRPVSE